MSTTVNPPPRRDTELTIDELVATLREEQMAFIIKALVAAGHISREVLDASVNLSRWVK